MGFKIGGLGFEVVRTQTSSSKCGPDLYIQQDAFQIAEPKTDVLSNKLTPCSKPLESQMYECMQPKRKGFFFGFSFCTLQEKPWLRGSYDPPKTSVTLFTTLFIKCGSDPQLSSQKADQRIQISSQILFLKFLHKWLVSPKELQNRERNSLHKHRSGPVRTAGRHRPWAGGEREREREREGERGREKAREREE